MYNLLTAEPVTNTAGVWVFGSILFFASFSFVMSIVFGGKKEEESREAANNRERKEWTRMRAIRPDDPEDAIINDNVPRWKETADTLN